MEVSFLFRNRPIVFALTILLLLSIIANIMQYYIYKNVDSSIVGTYCTGEGKSTDDKYYIFDQEGNYIWYRQFEIMEQGRYTVDENHMYFLNSDSATTMTVLYFNGVLYNSRGSHEFVAYRKISDVPTLVNVETTEDDAQLKPK